MNKIGIKFTDRDFSRTFVGVLKIIRSLNNKNFSDKQALLNYINAIAEDCYTLYQKGEQPTTLNLKYLTIEDKHLFIDSEVDALLESDYFRNGEFHVLDISNGTIDSF